MKTSFNGLRFLVLLTVSVCLMFPTLGAAKMPLRGSVKVLKLGTVAPEHTPWAQSLHKLQDLIEGQDKKAVTVKPFMGGRLGNETFLLKSCIKGEIDIVAVSGTVVADIIPELDILEFPYLFESEEEADWVIDTILTNKILSKLEKNGLVLLGWAENGFMGIASTDKAIHFPNDMEGMSFRSQESRVAMETLASLGTKPMKLGVRDVALSLKSGIIHGFQGSVVWIGASGWSKASKYFLKTRHAYQPALVMASKKSFDNWPKVVKSLFRLPNEELTRFSREVIRRSEDQWEEKLKKDGMIVSEVTEEQHQAFAKRTEVVYARKSQILGLSGAELLDEVLRALKQRRAGGADAVRGKDDPGR